MSSRWAKLYDHFNILLYYSNENHKKKTSRFIIEISIVRCPILHKILIVLNCPIQKHLKGKVQPHVVPNLFDTHTHTHNFFAQQKKETHTVLEQLEGE